MANKFVNVQVKSKTGTCVVSQSYPENLISETYFFQLSEPLLVGKNRRSLVIKDPFGVDLFVLGETKLAGKIDDRKFEGIFVVTVHPILSQRCQFDMVISTQDKNLKLLKDGGNCQTCGASEDAEQQLRQTRLELQSRNLVLASIRDKLGDLVKTQEPKHPKCKKLE